MEYIEKNIRLIIIVLTGILILLGGYMWFSGEGADFADAVSYEAARASGDLSHTAPVLPECATDIEVVTRGAIVEEVNFRCDDRVARARYLVEVEDQFEWNTSVIELDRVVMERVD